MKIRNKKFNVEYSSPTLEWDADWRCYKDYIPSPYAFQKEDGWEEVKEGLSTRITSLSEEQKTSIINILRDTLTTWVHEGVIDMIVDVFEPRLSELNLWK